MNVFWIFLLLAIPLSGWQHVQAHQTAWEEPWGKDALLSSSWHVEKESPSPSSWLQRVGVVMIRFHQQVISPIDGPRSHYFPSSSQYTKEAICNYGFFKGVMMGCDRLMRENGDPWIYPITRASDGRPLKKDLP